MRPIVSYDDITEPYNSRQGSGSSAPPASKKRKMEQPPAPVDDVEDEEEDEDEEMSRELTQDEIWDDSALIRAWDAANAEYEAYHGPDKGWKKKPVESSPLWYNVPPPPSKKKKKSQKSKQTVQESKNAQQATTASGSQDSKPLDFSTFMPVHDASLSAADIDVDLYEEQHQQAYTSVPFSSVSDPSTLAAGISQDEAFSRAMGAMYWTGYWSAIYHMKSQQKQGNEQEDDEAVMENGVVEEEIDDGFVSSQR